MIRGAAWNARENEGGPRNVKHGQARILPADDFALDYRSRLNRIETTLSSILEAAQFQIAREEQRARTDFAKDAQPPVQSVITECSPPERERVRSEREPRLQGRRAEVLEGAPRSGASRDPLPLVSLEDEIDARTAATLEKSRSKDPLRTVEQRRRIFSVDKLQTESAKVAEALRDLDSHGTIVALEQAVRGLTQKIESSHGEGVSQTVLQSLEQLVGELKRSINQIAPRQRIAKVGAEAKVFASDHLDEPIERALRSERNEGHMPRFVENIDRQRASGQEKLTGARSAYEGAPALAKIEQRLDIIAAKVEEIVAEARGQGLYEELSQRIENVRQDLTVRIAEAWLEPDTKPLEQLLQDLSEKLDNVERSPGEKQAIQALERQLSALTEQFDRSNAGFSSVAAIEETIGELFSEIEKTREVAFAAAEHAARQVLNEVSTDRTHDAEIGDEIQRLRTFHDAADRRTLSTLTTVHDVLQKLFDRLAVIEGVLSNRPSSGERQASEASAGITPLSRPQIELGDTGASGKKPLDELDDIFSDVRGGFSTFGEMSAGQRDSGSHEQEWLAGRPAQAAGAPAPKKRDPARALQTRNFFAEHKNWLLVLVAAMLVALCTFLVLQTINKTGPTSVSSNVSDSSAIDNAPGNDGAPASASAPGPPVSAPQTSASVLPEPQTIASAPQISASQLSSPPAPEAPASDLQPAALEPQSQMQAGATTVTAATSTSAPSSSFGPTTLGVTADTRSLSREIGGRDELQIQAEGANAKAQFALATDYVQGRGRARDVAAAARWYLKAAEHGMAPAQSRLGFLYQQGLGVPPDPNKARTWYLKAAEQGNVAAMYNLAVLAADSRPDYATAVVWFKKAAEYGLLNSEFNLAILLARGLGAQQNLVAAYAWFSIAAAQGDHDAAKKRDDLAERLDTDQLAAGRAMAASFRAKQPDATANDESLAGSWKAVPASVSKVQEPEASQF
jgi:localization factor PodJL